MERLVPDPAKEGSLVLIDQQVSTRTVDRELVAVEDAAAARDALIQRDVLQRLASLRELRERERAGRRQAVDEEIPGVIVGNEVIVLDIIGNIGLGLAFCMAVDRDVAVRAESRNSSR